MDNPKINSAVFFPLTPALPPISATKAQDPTIKILSNFESPRPLYFEPKTGIQRWLIRFLTDTTYRSQQSANQINFRIIELRQDIADEFKGPRDRAPTLTALTALAVQYMNDATPQKNSEKSWLALQEQAMNTAEEVLQRTDLESETAVTIMLSILDSLPAYKRTECKKGFFGLRYLNKVDKEDRNILKTISRDIFSTNTFKKMIANVMEAMKKHALSCEQQTTVMEKMVVISHADAYALEAVENWMKKYCEDRNAYSKNNGGKEEKAATQIIDNNLSRLLLCGTKLAFFIAKNTQVEYRENRKTNLLQHEVEVLLKLQSFLETNKKYTSDGLKISGLIETAQQSINDMLNEHNEFLT